MNAFLDRVQQRALIAGVVALAACGVGAFISPEQFFRSYLVAYVFWIGIAVGCFAIVMLHHMVGGRWGMAIRRYLESGTRTLPLMMILVVPLLFGLRHLYLWAQPAMVDKDALLKHKALYLNIPFFIGRTVAYFAIWYALSYFLNKWSAEQDQRGWPAVRDKLQTLSAPGLMVYGLTVTFASIDWVMSLEPHWFSTIYGALFMVGQGLSTLAFCILVTRMLASEEVDSNQFHDLGNLMFAFTMLWAYMSFSQFLIIWSGNLPEEITWYLRRFHGGWEYVAMALLLFHFAVPFLLLLSRALKKHARMLSRVAMWMLVVRLVDVFWLVQPAFAHEEAPHFSLHWMDLAAPIGVGGLWIAFFVWQLKRRPLEPAVAG